MSTQAAKAVRKDHPRVAVGFQRQNQRPGGPGAVVNPAVRGWMNYYGRFLPVEVR